LCGSHPPKAHTNVTDYRSGVSKRMLTRTLTTLWAESNMDEVLAARSTYDAQP